MSYIKITLPVEQKKRKFILVPGRGIEPPTKSLGNFCSIH